jgi:nicotinamidase-related amidase
VLDVGADEPVVSKQDDDGFAGTGLDSLLRSRGATRVCVIGIQSEMCVAGTARGALSRGYGVVLPRDGHTTYDVPPDDDAPAVPAALVSRVAEWSLGDEVVAPGRLADVVFVRPAT